MIRDVIGIVGFEGDRYFRRQVVPPTLPILTNPED